MRTRQQADFARDLAQVARSPAVDAFSLEDQVADDALFQPLQGLRDLGGGVFPAFRSVFLRDTFLDDANGVSAGRLAGGLLQRAELVIDLLPEDRLARVLRQVLVVR